MPLFYPWLILTFLCPFDFFYVKSGQWLLSRYFLSFNLGLPRCHVFRRCLQKRHNCPALTANDFSFLGSFFFSGNLAKISPLFPTNSAFHFFKFPFLLSNQISRYRYPLLSRPEILRRANRSHSMFFCRLGFLGLPHGRKDKSTLCHGLSGA